MTQLRLTLGGLLGFPYWRERLLRHRKLWACVALTLVSATAVLWYLARPRAARQHTLSGLVDMTLFRQRSTPKHADG